MSSSNPVSLESFLTAINPQFSKYVTILQEQGLSEVENLSVMQDDDFKHLGIPLFHWRQIVAKAKVVTSDTPEGGGDKDNNQNSQSKSQIVSPQSQTSSRTQSNSLANVQKPKPKSEAANWDSEVVTLWVRTYDNGAYAQYASAFTTNNVDGARLIGMDGVKELASIVPDLGARYGIYQAIEQLRNGDVPSVQSLLEKDKEVQQKLKTQKTNDDNTIITNINLDNTNNDNNNEWTQSDNSDHFKKNDKINLQVKSKDDSSVRQRLIKFYEIYNPQKLDDNDGIDELLHRYQGKEAQLFGDLEKKYILSVPKTNYIRKQIDTSFDNKTDMILRTLSSLYTDNIRQIEEAFNFPEFHTPLLDEVDFLAKPMILLVGQYSVGKTSFIRYLLGRDFPGARIGPEPTTDGFFAIMHGSEERIIPGHTVPMDRTKPFRTLQGFGAGFLNKFNCVEVPAPILESVTFIDTPGILSGEKQRLGRNYDFAKAIEWFAYRVDRILILFDAHKLDISDELKAALDTLKGHDDKVRCILNKADQINNQQLLRVYGALMWSLGKVFKTPEVLRIYVGSFWEEPYANDHNAELFDSESDDLLSDLRSLPRHCATRKINEFVKRTRQLKVHCLIIEHLRKQFGWFGKDKKQNQLLNNLKDEFKVIAKEQGLNLNDFPNPDKFRTLIEQFDVSKFPKLKEKWLESLNNILEEEVPKLMRTLPSHDNPDEKGDQAASNPFANVDNTQNAKLDPTARWAVSQTDKAKHDTKFYQLQLQNGKASGNQVMSIMTQSGLTREVLKTIWDLSDIDQDGKMDHEEFALCMYLIDMVKGGIKLPPTLPIALIPPGKRDLVEYQ